MLRSKKTRDQSNKKSESKALVARYACGSVGLQVKRFVTASEKRERKERVLAEKFI